MSYKIFMTLKKKNNQLSRRMLLFLEHRSVSCKSSSLGHYITALNHLDSFLKQTFKTNSITQFHLLRLKRTHLEKYLIGIHQKKLAPYTKVNYLLNSRLYLEWEAERQKIDPKILSVLDRKHFPKVPEYLPKPLSTENDQKITYLFRNTKSPYGYLFLLLRLTGLRISELITLPWECVITNEKNEKFLRVPPGKMDMERLVPLSNEAIQTIDAIKELYPFRLNKCNKERLIGLKGPVSSVSSFLVPRFKKITGDFTDQNKPVTFHRLRHTYATSLLAGGVSIISIMKLLGHRRIEMSLRYAKVTPSHLRNEYLKAVEVIQKQVGLEYVHHNTKEKNGEYIDPVDTLYQIYALTKKSAILNSRARKTLLQRLSRLKKDIENVLFKSPHSSDHP